MSDAALYRAKRWTRNVIRVISPLWFALADYVCDNEDRETLRWRAARRAESWIASVNAWAECDCCNWRGECDE